MQLKCRISLHQALFTLFSFIWFYSFKLSWTANQIKILLLAPNEFCCCQQLQPFGYPLFLVPPLSRPVKQAVAAATKIYKLNLLSAARMDGWRKWLLSVVCPSVGESVPATVHCPQSHSPTVHLPTVPLSPVPLDTVHSPTMLASTCPTVSQSLWAKLIFVIEFVSQPLSARWPWWCKALAWWRHMLWP